jgi:hypothetical protein
VAAELGKAERGFLAQGADAQANAFFRDEGFDSVAADLHIGMSLRDRGNFLLFGDKNVFR